MDFDNVKADTEQIIPCHYTSGRDGGIRFIVLHWNAGDLTVEDCYRVWTNREASAHYQVESSGRVGQLVWDADTAWATGNYNGNAHGISIEHANQGNSFTDACIENGARLCGALCRLHGLGEPRWYGNVFPHNHFSATQCPGALEDSEYLDRYMEIAVEQYNGTYEGENDMTPEQSEQLAYVYNQLRRTDTAGHSANPDGHDFYGRLQIVEEQVGDCHDRLTRTDNAGHKTDAGHDLYGRVNLLEEGQAEIKATLETILGKLG